MNLDDAEDSQHHKNNNDHTNDVEDVSTQGFLRKMCRRGVRRALPDHRGAMLRFVSWNATERTAYY